MGYCYKLGLLRHPVLWTEHPLFVSFSRAMKAIVELSSLHCVQSNINPLCNMHPSCQSASLENLDYYTYCVPFLPCKSMHLFVLGLQSNSIEHTILFIVELYRLSCSCSVWRSPFLSALCTMGILSYILIQPQLYQTELHIGLSFIRFSFI